MKMLKFCYLEKDEKSFRIIHEMITCDTKEDHFSLRARWQAFEIIQHMHSNNFYDSEKASLEWVLNNAAKYRKYLSSLAEACLILKAWGIKKENLTREICDKAEDFFNKNCRVLFSVY